MTKLTRILNDFYQDDEVMDYVSGREPLPEGAQVNLNVVLGAEVIRPLFVIVECYDHKKYGRGKREWLKQFNEEERKIISSWYLRLYAMHLKTGIPVEGVQMKMKTLGILQRAANFFATL